jgi:hypothetical protein
MSYLFFPFQEVVGLWSYYFRLQYTIHARCARPCTPSSHMNINSDPTSTPPPPFQLHQHQLLPKGGHTNNFGIFLRRLALTKGSTVLYITLCYGGHML